MASHFSSIGFSVNTEDQFLGLAESASQDAEVIEVPQGKYLRRCSESGAELWIQVSEGDALVGMMPHFSGKSRIRVGITGRVLRPEGTPLDGAFQGWAEASDEDPETGTYPFVFDTPDYCRHAGLILPKTVSAQVAAFAHKVTLFQSLGDFEATQNEEPKFAAQSFIPSGLFSPAGEKNPIPHAYAIFTGHVVEVAKMRNELTEQPFHWALVESLGGSYDVLIDPELVAEQPQVGGVLTGSFWLSGRIIK